MKLFAAIGEYGQTLGAGALGFLLRHLLARTLLDRVSWGVKGGSMLTNDFKALLGLIGSLLTTGSGTATVSGPTEELTIPGIGVVTVNELVTLSVAKKS